MFQTFFYQPILNLVVFLYDIIPGHDLGLAIIALTLVIKLALLPLSKKSIKSQKALQELQPKIEEIKRKHKDNKEEQTKAMMEMYKNNKVNPFSSCLPLLIQLPFLIAVFQVFRNGFENGALDLVYPFIERPESINYISLGFFDLSQKSTTMAILAGAAQFWQTKMMMHNKPTVKSPGAQDENMMAMMNKQMMYFMPIMTVFIAMGFPSGLALYWLITTLFTIAQQYYVFGRGKKDDGDKKNDSGGGKVVEGEIV